MAEVHKPRKRTTGSITKGTRRELKAMGEAVTVVWICCARGNRRCVSST